jgi:hypothetical protein
MSKYNVYTRPYNLGAGFNMFRSVKADSPKDACDKVFKKEGERPPSDNGYNRFNDGTPEKPFVFNGGASECCAEETIR